MSGSLSSRFTSVIQMGKHLNIIVLPRLSTQALIKLLSHKGGHLFEGATYMREVLAYSTASQGNSVEI